MYIVLRAVATSGTRSRCSGRITTRASITSGYNANSIGICYEGGLDENGKPADTRTPAQKAALIALLRSLKVDYPDAEIKGHCELKGVHKDCPCFSCQEYRDYFARLSHLAN